MSEAAPNAALPEGWTIVSVRDLAEYINGFAFKPADWGSVGRPIIRIQNLTDPRKPFNYTTRVAPDRVAIAPGDILVSWSATLDAFVWRGPPAVLNQHIFKVVPKDLVSDRRFLFYALKEAIAELGRGEHAHGSTMTHVNRGPFLAHPMPLPPPAVQSAIADALDAQLSRRDAAAATLERARRNLKRYRASVLKAAVEGRLVPTEASLARAEGRSYEPASELLARILEERRARWKASGKKGKYKEPVAPDTAGLRELPEGWCWATVEQLAFVSGGLTKNAKRDQLTTRVPYLRVANVYANELRLDDILEMGVSPAEYARVLLEVDDLLIVEGNGSPDQIGRAALWNGRIEPCAHQNHLIKARFVDRAIAPWGGLWLRSPSGRRVIEQVSSSTSGLHTLSLSKVASLPVALPPMREQGSITDEAARVLTIAAAAEASIEADLARLSALRSSILRSAFRGELV